MVKYKFYTAFFLMVLLGLTAVFVIAEGYYPIVVVDGGFISAKRFALNFSAAALYYQNIIKDGGVGDARVKRDDLEAAALTTLIEGSLISDGARRETGTDMDYLIGKKLDNFKNGNELDKISAAYGLSKNNFISEILMPQAAREILAGRLFLRGEKFEDWLAATKRSAHVVIFSPRFRWDGEKVMVIN